EALIPATDIRGAGSPGDSSGTVGCRRRQWPYLSPGAAVLADVPLEITAKVFQCGLEGIGGAGRERAKGVAGAPRLGLKCELREVVGLPVAVFHGFQNSVRPPEAAPARRAVAAGFLGEEVYDVGGHADRTGLVVEHDHGAGAHPAADLLH